MKAAILIILFLITGIPSTSWSATDNKENASIFYMESYNYALGNNVIHRAARCEVIDEFVYGKPETDYMVNAVMRLTIESNVKYRSHHLLEFFLAYSNQKSYYQGTLDSLKRLGAISNKELLKVSANLECSKFKELPIPNPPANKYNDKTHED